MASFSLVLGSSSKWRRQILEKLLGESGIPLSSLNPDIDEKAIRHPDPRKMTLAIARAKAEALIEKMGKVVVERPTLLICSDQVILHRSQAREKPVDAEEARAFLRSYREAPAEAVDAVVVYNTQSQQFYEGIATARQYFREVPETAIDALIAQGDVLYCAGGLVVEELSPFLGLRQGEEETIIGLPVALTYELLHAAGAVGLPPLTHSLDNPLPFAVRILCSNPHGSHRVAVHIFDPPCPPQEKVADRLVICVPGLSRNAMDFRELATATARDQRCRVLSIDLPGRGISEWLSHEEDYSYPQYLSDLKTVLTAFGFFGDSKKTLDWVGTSLGGLLGMFFSSIHPGAIRRLVLNDIGPFVPLSALRRLGTYVGDGVEFASLEEAEKYMRSKFAPFGDLTDDEWAALTQHSVTLSNSNPSRFVMNYDPQIGNPFRDPSRLTSDADMWATWAKVDQGVGIMLLRGETSDILPLEVAEEMVKRRPGPGLRAFRQFQGCGHVPTLVAKEQLDAVLGFLGALETPPPLTNLP